MVPAQPISSAPVISKLSPLIQIVVSSMYRQLQFGQYTSILMNDIYVTGTMKVIQISHLFHDLIDHVGDI